MQPEALPKTCREPVWNDLGIAYSCELRDLHTGPCMSESIRFTVVARRAWEESNPVLAEGQVMGDIIIEETHEHRR